MAEATDYKPTIIDALTILMKADQIKKETFKAIAYQKVIKQLQAHPGPIRSLEDLEGFTGIGTKIKAKIKEIIETGGLKAANQAAAAVPISIYDDLLKIHGIGPVKARRLVEDFGVTSIEDLRQKVTENPGLLDHAQKVGLQFFEEFNERIPRAEMEAHEAIITDSAPSNMKFEIVGSYRRGAASSGDIDILINFPRLRLEESIVESFHEFIQSLIAKGYITDMLALGNHKCMAVSKVGPDGKHRRLDVLLTPNEEWPFAILYFTGSDRFNVAMRAHALELGWTLNEHRIAPTSKTHQSGAELPAFKTEKDIFKFLGLRYIEPTERTGAEKVMPL